MTILLAFVAAALFVIGLITLSNLLLFPRLGRPLRPLPADPPLVSVLVPARDEAQVIGQTVRAILAQSYPRLEVLVLDDQSSDGTSALAREAAGGDGRLRVMAGAPLPDGWLGKNWACSQLAEAAGGEWLVFTDADVVWQPGALAALIGEAEHERADLLSIWPTQETVTWGERLVVPLMALVVLGYLPILGVHALPGALFAAANGQCMAFRRESYTRVGGHARVRAEVVEDVVLARRVKACGLRLRMADGAGQIGCRMYRNWAEVRDGYAKNILSGYGGSTVFLFLATVFHWAVFLLPWVLWPWEWRFALLAATGVLVRAVTADFTRQRARDALLMPVSVVLMTVIAWRSVVWHFRGGPRWKGRVARVS